MCQIFISKQFGPDIYLISIIWDDSTDYIKPNYFELIMSGI